MRMIPRRRPSSRHDAESEQLDGQSPPDQTAPVAQQQQQQQQGLEVPGPHDEHPSGQQRDTPAPAPAPVPAAKEKEPSRSRLKRGLTKDGFTSFLRQVPSAPSSTHSARSGSADGSNSAAAGGGKESGGGFHMPRFRRSHTLSDIHAGEPAPAPVGPAPGSSGSNAGFAESQSQPTSQQPTPGPSTPAATPGPAAPGNEGPQQKHRRRLTPSLPNLKDTFKKPMTGRRKSTTATPSKQAPSDAAVPPASPTSHPPSIQETPASPTSNSRLRAPGSLDLSAAPSVRSAKSRFSPSLQNIGEHPAGDLLYPLEETASNTWTNSGTDAGSVRHGQGRDVRRLLFPVDRKAAEKGGRPTSAPGQLQEPKVDLLDRKMPPGPRMADSSTQTDLLPPPPPAAEPAQGASRQTEGDGMDTQTRRHPGTAPNTSSHSTQSEDGTAQRSQSPRRATSMPLVPEQPEALKPPTRTRSRGSSQSSARRSISEPAAATRPEPPLSPRSPTTTTTTMGLSGIGMSEMDWRLKKANTSAKRQGPGSPTQQTPPPPPASNMRLSDLPIPEPPAGLRGLGNSRSPRGQQSTPLQSPGASHTPRSSSRPIATPLELPSTPGGSDVSTMFKVPGTPTGGMSVAAGVSAALLGALSGALIVSARLSTPAPGGGGGGGGGGSGPKPSFSIGEASPFSSASVDAGNIKRRPKPQPQPQHPFEPMRNEGLQVKETPRETQSSSSSMADLLQAAQSESAWQRKWRLRTHQGYADTEGLHFDDKWRAAEAESGSESDEARSQASTDGRDRDAEGSREDKTETSSSRDGGGDEKHGSEPREPALRRLGAILRQFNGGVRDGMAWEDSAKDSIRKLSGIPRL